MPLVQVGFDGSLTECMFGRSNDTLRTEGLANCIAIVARDNAGRGALMRHYDTRHAFSGTGPTDPISNGRPLTFNGGILNTLRDAMIRQLRNQLNDQRAAVSFVIGLGAIWYDVNPNSSLWVSRHNLIIALNNSFGVEPVVAGGTIIFIVNNATMQLA